MSTRPPRRKVGAQRPIEERRAPAGAEGTALRRLKGMLGRPIGLERRGGALHVVLVDRRRAAAEDPILAHLRDELRARLLAQEHDQATHVLRHLGFVHDELGRQGWRGVEALPAPVLGKALAQAQMLADEEPSDALATLVERLRPMLVAARLRDERAAGEVRAPGDTPPAGAEPPAADDLLAADSRVEVTDATHEEFEQMERGWVDTVHPGIERPEGER